MKIFETFESISIGSISLATILSAILVFLICLVVIRIFNVVAKRLLNKSRLDGALRSFIASAVNIVLWALAVVVVAGALGIPTASLVAVISVAGLALSLSVQGIMTNVFSGMTLIGTKPFAAGDYVEINGMQGTVKELRLFYTSILTVDNRVVHIPNSEVAAAKVVNFSSEPRRRVDLLFTASYGCPTEKVKNAILEVVDADSRILRDPAPFVSILSYKASSIEYVVRAWVASADYWDVYFAVNEGVRESFARNGVEMTYEHVNVHMVQ